MGILEEIMEKLQSIENMLKQGAQQPDELLTIQDAAKMLHLNVQTVYRYIRNNDLPHIKKGKRVYFVRSELMDYMKTKRRTTIADLRSRVDTFLAERGGNTEKIKEFIFKETEWKTPNTYDTNFSDPTDKAGVYLIMNYESEYKFEILYVGSAKNLKNRYKSHSLLNTLKMQNKYVRFYFKETANYLQDEIKLIKSIKPKYNIKHNGTKKPALHSSIRTGLHD